jgi:hypothetical protein
MKHTTERSYVIATLLTAALLAAQPLGADEVKIRIPAPPVPKIVLPAPPPMIWLPVPQVYVAHDSPHHIFFHGGHYYLFHHDLWYMGSAHAGPWTRIKVKQLPPGLHKYRGGHWREYQREAAQRFREDRDAEHRPFYAGRPHEHAHWKDDEHDRGRHGGREKKEKKEKHGRDDD